MSYTLFSISAYIFMRAFEVTFSDKKDAHWYKKTIRIIGFAVLYSSVAAMIGFYFNGIHFLGFDPE